MLKTKAQLCTVSEKSKRNDARILQRNSKSSVNIINGSIQESECKINTFTHTQLKKLKTAVKNKIGNDGSDLPLELLLKTRQRMELINAFSNNISTDIKLSKAQISKINQSGGFLGSLLSKSSGPLMKVAAPLEKIF